MKTIKNHVQLIGNLGQEPSIIHLESGKKVANFSLATNEFHKNSNGERVQDTQWHNIVAWGKTAEIIEKYAGKGSEIVVSGKLKYRSYEDKESNTRYVTEVEAKEILLLSIKNGNNSAD
ncbi:single-stranded DNA-binding protein [Antarcticibacterium flavum]|uniref:Single-stranded DNA-binding protein n=1 Tax=Antarcticibacterium flavum TaxID=2058175 RepID=A0A5B7X4E1_9FLAO|nr:MULTISPECIES: single-stranded DNA-binding protein [Antarcticibacterium]MCM4158432.1 single-stranded DNA-binding protein [Antarcticibacterium sp. W02-3]QCY70189.1 single-stranded DNA-binding protein [Antarcticibacterium flavum]